MRKRIFIILSAFFITTTPIIPSHAAVVPSSSATTPGNEPDPAKIKAAVMEFKALPKKERKTRIKQVKQALKDFKKERRKGNDPDVDTLLLVILAILLPPLAVYLHQGETNQKFWITTLLFVLGIIGVFLISWLLWLAAVVYALIVILGNG
jgi:uncharacterized membrane protein YqaE (UPF0057 family)